MTTNTRQWFARALLAPGIAVVTGILVAPVHADEIHLKNGKLIEGLLQEQSSTGYVFLEVDARRPKTIKSKDVECLVLNYALPK